MRNWSDLGWNFSSFLLIFCEKLVFLRVREGVQKLMYFCIAFFVIFGDFGVPLGVPFGSLGGPLAGFGALFSVFLCEMRLFWRRLGSKTFPEVIFHEFWMVLG